MICCCLFQNSFLTTEAYASHDATMRFYGNEEKPGSHFPFNFLLLTNLDGETNALNLNDTIAKYLSSMDDNKYPNWVVSQTSVVNNNYFILWL